MQHIMKVDVDMGQNGTGYQYQLYKGVGWGGVGGAMPYVHLCTETSLIVTTMHSVRLFAVQVSKRYIKKYWNFQYINHKAQS